MAILNGIAANALSVKLRVVAFSCCEMTTVYRCAPGHHPPSIQSTRAGQCIHRSAEMTVTKRGGRPSIGATPLHPRARPGVDGLLCTFTPASVRYVDLCKVVRGINLRSHVNWIVGIVDSLKVTGKEPPPQKNVNVINRTDHVSIKRKILAFDLPRLASSPVSILSSGHSKFRFSMTAVWLFQGLHLPRLLCICGRLYTPCYAQSLECQQCALTTKSRQPSACGCTVHHQWWGEVERERERERESARQY